MTQKDYLFIKNKLDKSYLNSDYLSIIKVGGNPKDGFNTLKIVYSNCIITICDGMGYAYLISWWCDGSITSGKAQDLTNICREYNARF